MNTRNEFIALLRRLKHASDLVGDFDGDDYLDVWRIAAAQAALDNYIDSRIRAGITPVRGSTALTVSPAEDPIG